MIEQVVAASGVCKSYGEGRARIDALRPVDFAVERGEFVIVSGPSGSGKSTLLAILSGLLSPSAGRVEVLGENLHGLSRDRFDRFRLDHFGFIFQGFHLLPALSAREQVSIVLERQGLKPRLAAVRAEAALAAVGLVERAGQRPATLSGGERQRVAIARALAKRPQVIFADEPTSALDRENGRQIARLLQTAAVDDRAAVICVSHDPRMESYASRVVHMEDGAFLS